MNDFDGIAWCYDPVKRMVFGDKLDQAAAHFIPQILPGSKVLIVGGGTGNILQDFPPEVDIVYVEKSLKMMSRAKNKMLGNIEYINEDFLNYQPAVIFDFIICPFFLDLFDPVSLSRVIHKIKSMLSPKGQLLVADFSFQRSILLMIMYISFRILSNISARKIPPIHTTLEDSGFELLESRKFLDGLVFSSLYGHLSK